VARTRTVLNTSLTAGSTGHISDSNVLNRFQNAGGGGPVSVVAASDAPSYVKDRADWVCDGTSDQAEIQDALDTYGSVQLSEGTFNVSGTISMTATHRLRGAGVDQTTIAGTANTFHVLHLGNRQADGIMRNFMALEDLSVTSVGGANSFDTIWCDGFGNGSYLRNIKVSEGRYNLRITDADQASFWNVKAFNARTAGIYCEVGLENTWGNVAFYSPSVASSDNSAICWLWDANANQASPNRFDRITITGALFYTGTGLTGSVGVKHAVGASSLTWVGCLFENNLIQYQCIGQTEAVFLGCSFMRNAGGNSTDIFNLQTNQHHLTVLGCRFQQGTNLFNAVSGSPQLALHGINENQGNLTNLFVGSFGWKTGTDTVFAGSSILASGLNGQPYDYGFFNHCVTGDLQMTGTAPTAAAGANAGTSPPAPVVQTGAFTSRGEVTFGTGTTPAAGAQVTVTFNSATSQTPVVTLVPRNSATASLGLYVSAVSTTAFTVSTTSAPAASQANTTYRFGWHVLA
jgi:hypothetical protein